MNILALILVSFSFQGGSSISGHVLDGQGRPLADARVFLEQGLAAPLVESKSLADGSYRFEDLRPGQTQVIAIAVGRAFGGRHVIVRIAENVRDLDIVLAGPGKVSGKVATVEGQAVPGARITRVALLDGSRVSFPFTKLRPYGFRESVSDSDGRFTIENLPGGRALALKVVHPQFAQEGAMGMKVGDSNAEVTLHRGVLVSGHVFSRGSEIPAARASVTIRKSEPPLDTVTAITGTDGSFTVRLKPGAYDCRAAGAAFRSPTGHRLLVTGQTMTQNLTLYVSGTGTVLGKVMDAKSGEPIEGAVMTLEALGSLAERVRTGPSGEYRFSAAEGENVVRLDAAPGYGIPTTNALRFEVIEGGEVEVPSFWLAPLPTYSLLVLGPDEQPVAKAVVRIIRPPQFGWHVTGPDGRVELAFAALPPDGTVVGVVEDLRDPLGALFAIEKSASQEAVVQLTRLARVEGRVTSRKDSGAPGLVVDARFMSDTLPESLVLWRTLTGKDGRFSWDGVIPFVPHRLVVHSASGGMGSSVSFIIDSAPVKDVGSIVVETDGDAVDVLGKRLTWYDNPVLCDGPATRESARGRPGVVIYCSAGEAEMVADGLAAARGILAGRDLFFAVVVDGDYRCTGAGLSVLQGTAPAAATTYLVDRSGAVVLETFGMPPVHALARIAPGEARQVR